MRVTIIGAGNVATQLGKSLKGCGVDIGQIYSRRQEAAEALARLCDAEAVSDPGEIEEGADFYIYSVKDDALGEVIRATAARTGIHVHTAGSIGIDVFNGTDKEKHGVIYPMQTFSKQKDVDFRGIPIFIEGNTKGTTEELRGLGERLSDTVTVADSETRKTMHIGAVFCCNFTNYMYRAAAEILREKGLDFRLMLPLIKETTWKLEAMTPAEAQTGPANRMDMKVINEHLSYLNDSPDLKGLYVTITNAIINNREKQTDGTELQRETQER